MPVFLKIANSVFMRNYINYFPLYCVNSAKGIRKFSVDVNTVPNDSEEIDVYNQKKERILEDKRNVSRLNPQHRNLLNDKVPYPEPQADYHISVKYRRKMYGIYGSESGVNPGIMFPTKQDIEDRKEYESVAYPMTIQEMVREETSRIEAEEMQLLERQNKIVTNMIKLKKWMKDLETKRAKKIKEITDAKAKKDKLVEEVRRHFGYAVDHRDERFQQLLEQKEKEEKKTRKLERKKKRDEMIMQELVEHSKKITTDN